MRPAALAALAALTLAACSAEPIQADPPRPAPTGAASDFSATGELPCSADGAALDRRCPFGISIGGGGRLAALQVVNPTSDVEGIQRVLLYEQGTWSTLSDAPVETRPIDGGTLIVIGDREFYALPARVFPG